MQTDHARVRAHQRAIPPQVDQWLEDYGDEQYDGNGGVKRYFSHASVRKMERDLGATFVRFNSRWFRAYKVASARDGATITVGWLQRRIRR
jgi:hypothetical protein